MRLRTHLLSASMLVLVAAAVPANAQTTISTDDDWTGFGGWPWGTTGPQTVGQTITVPGRDNVLDSFTFWLSNLTNGDRTRLRGLVIAWDPEAVAPVGGILFQSDDVPAASGDFREYFRYDFTTGGLRLESNRMYALLVSVAGVPDNPVIGGQILANIATSEFPIVRRDVYGGGGAVQLAFGVPGASTTLPWFEDPEDQRFVAVFSPDGVVPPPAVVPEPATLLLSGAGLLVLGAYGYRRGHRCA